MLQVNSEALPHAPAFFHRHVLRRMRRFGSTERFLEQAARLVPPAGDPGALLDVAARQAMHLNRPVVIQNTRRDNTAARCWR